MRISRLATIIGFLLVFASLANGSVSYLKRIGWLEHATYTKFMETYCSGPEGSLCLCMREPLPQQFSGSISNSSTRIPDEQYIYANNGYERLLKISKDLLFAGFIIFSCYLIQAKRARPPDPGALVPPLLLLANVGIGVFISLILWGGVFALAGLRSFGFLAIALVGGWAFSGIQGIARCVAALLTVQLVLVCIEVFIGVPLRDCPNSFRAAGTMVLPNSLGVFTVVGLAFYLSYSSDKLYFRLLVVLAAITLFASGSGTGILVLFVLLSMLSLINIAGLRKWVTAITLFALSAALLAKLPALIHRPDVYDSVFSSAGRVGKLIEVVSESSAIEILFGRGIGFGTNAATNMISSDVTGGKFFRRLHGHATTDPAWDNRCHLVLRYFSLGVSTGS